MIQEIMGTFDVPLMADFFGKMSVVLVLLIFLVMAFRILFSKCNAAYSEEITELKEKLSIREDEVEELRRVLIKKEIITNQ